MERERNESGGGGEEQMEKEREEGWREGDKQRSHDNRPREEQALIQTEGLEMEQAAEWNKQTLI